MGEKKLTDSKLWIFFDWVWRLMVLNVLVILTSIGIITIVPAICAAFKSIKDTKENYTSSVIRNYFINFRYLFRDTFGFSIILILLVGICGYAFLWYDGVVGTTQGNLEQMDQTWLTIAIVSIVIVILGMFILLMAFIQIPMVVNYFYYGFIDNIKLSFYMAFKYIITALLETVVVIASLYVLLTALFEYYLIPIWLFFGISLPLYVMYTLSRRFYRYMADTFEDEDEDIDYQNKTVNRETYEDDTKTIKGEQKND